MSKVFEKYTYDTKTKLDNFEKFVNRQALSRFLARYELFKMILNVKGSIVEAGVHHGGGLFSWAKMSSIYEPYAHKRKIIGFDTFEGFPDVSPKDIGGANLECCQKGGFSLSYDAFTEMQECVKEYDDNRFLNQINKIQLVKGDATKTIPKFIEDNPHTVIALLFLDFDIYEPTKTALSYLLPRVPKGGIVAFDEINDPYWPGETAAVLEKFITLNELRIQKFEFDPHISYVVL